MSRAARTSLAHAATEGCALASAHDWVWAGEQLQSELAGLVLLEVAMPRPWERVVQLQLGPRHSDPATRAVWLEVMGRWDPRPCLVARSARPEQCVGDRLLAAPGVLGVVEAAEGCAWGHLQPFRQALLGDAYMMGNDAHMMGLGNNASSCPTGPPLTDPLQVDHGKLPGSQEALKPPCSWAAWLLACLLTTHAG